MKKKILLTTAAAVAAFSHTQPIFAQEVAQTAAEEEKSVQSTIVVTGRKREETLLEAPISVSAFDAEALNAVGATSAQDIADLTPGLQISGDFGRTGERPVIRGIANLRSETPQPDGLFVDGVYVRTGIISSILDNVERVEVLKGPQGALYGRSTYGGVINYITKKPSDEFEGVLKATYAEHDEVEFSGNFSGPLFPGVNGLIGGRFYEYGGEYQNTAALSQGARDIGSQKTTAFYGALNIAPESTSAFDANIRAYYSEDEDGQFAGQLFDSTNNNSARAGGTACPNVLATRSYYCGVVEVPDSVAISTAVGAGEVVNPTSFFAPVTAAWDFSAGLNNETTRIWGDASYDITDSLTLSYMGGFTKSESHNIVNQSYSEVIAGYSFGPARASAWVTDSQGEREYWSHELRLNGEIGDNIDWIAGVFAYDEEQTGIDRNILETAYDFSGGRTNQEVAAYGSIDFSVTDNFGIGFEGRYYSEDVGADLSSDGETGDDLTETFDGFTWRATADYTFNNGALLYGSVSTGNKSGGFNTAINPNDPEEAPFLSFDEEKVTQYEVGFKSELFDGRGSVTAAVYAIDLVDQQLSQVVILREGQPNQVQTTVVLNVGETEIRGFEGDFNFNVTDQLKIGAAVSLSDNEFKKGSDPTQATIIDNGVTDPADPNYGSLVGFSVPRVSKNSGTVMANYEFMDTGEWTGNLRVDGVYASSRYAQVHNLQETGESFKTNLRLTLAHENSGTDIVFWGRNIGDDDTAGNVFRYVDPNDFRFFARSYVSFLPRGRQLGVTVRKSF